MRRKQKGGYFIGKKRQRGGYLKAKRSQRGGTSILTEKVTNKFLNEIAKGTKMVKKMGKVKLKKIQKGGIIRRHYNNPYGYRDNLDIIYY